MRKAIVSLAAALTLSGAVSAAASEGVEIPTRDWSFQGIFGTYDRAAAQRGLQIYKEVCSACHSLELLYYRNLADLGYSSDAVKAFASQFEVQDGPNDEGEMYNRPGKPSDHFVKPFPNDKAARAANGGALPPDLSLIIKARKKGPDYVYALLTGYHEDPTPEFIRQYEAEKRKQMKDEGLKGEPEPFKMTPGMYFNDVFNGHQIAMPPPLSEGSVEFADGTKATLDQEAHDIVTFLAWASEPTMEARKQMGIKVMLFLIVFTGLLIAVKKRVWSNLH